MVLPLVSFNDEWHSMRIPKQKEYLGALPILETG